MKTPLHLYDNSQYKIPRIFDSRDFIDSFFKKEYLRC